MNNFWAHALSLFSRFASMLVGVLTVEYKTGVWGILATAILWQVANLSEPRHE